MGTLMRDHGLTSSSKTSETYLLRPRLYRPAFIWFSVALVLRCVSTLVLHVYSLEAGFEGFYPLSSGGDDRYYFEVAIAILEGHHPTDLPNAYPIFLAFLFKIFGPNILVGKFFNAFLGSLGVYYGVLIAREVTRHSRGTIPIRHHINLVGLSLTLYPSALFCSTQLLKDPLIFALGMAMLYTIIRLLNRQTVIRWILFGALAVLLGTLRMYTLLAIFATFVFYMAICRKINLWSIVFLSAIISSVPQVLGWGWFGWNFIAHWILDVNEIQTFRETAYSIGGSSIGISLKFDDPLGLLLSYGYSLITVLIGPLPWQITSHVVAIALLESIPMWIVTFYWIKGFRRILAGNITTAEILFIFGLISSGMIALFSDNIGANTRLRLLAWGALLVYAGVVWSEQGSRRPRLKSPPVG